MSCLYTKAIAPSLHSLLAGIALGLVSERDDIVALFLAIAAHKAAASLAVGVKFVREG